MNFTLEVFKADKRTKTGQRKVAVDEIDAVDFKAAEKFGLSVYGSKCIVKVFETYVTRVNIMSREEYTEHYKTPACCSPACETYWSM